MDVSMKLMCAYIWCRLSGGFLHKINRYKKWVKGTEGSGLIMNL